MAVTKNQAADAQAESGIATGFVGASGPTGPAGPTRTDYPSRRRKNIAPPPSLHLVEPGDLITAQYINDLVLAVQNLQARVDDLEQIYDAAYRETMAAAAL